MRNAPSSPIPIHIYVRADVSQDTFLVIPCNHADNYKCGAHHANGRTGYPHPQGHLSESHLIFRPSLLGLLATTLANGSKTQTVAFKARDRHWCLHPPPHITPNSAVSVWVYLCRRQLKPQLFSSECDEVVASPLA